MADVDDQRPAPRAWDTHARGREWQQVIDHLTEAGWNASLVTSAAPVQLEGALPGGERFYFRARWNEITLAVGGQDPADTGAWECTVPYGDADADASWLDASDGLTILLDLVQQYRDAG